MKPIAMYRVRLSNAERPVVEAVEQARDEIGDDRGCDLKLRIETFLAKDIRHWIGNVWGWSTTINEMKFKDDRDRTRRIIKKAKRDGFWPYVSHWTSSRKELLETTLEDDGHRSAFNHGDGWHRIVAQLEAGAPTIDVVFIEGCVE